MPLLALSLFPAEQRCARCGENLRVWLASPHAYGVVHFATASDEMVAVDGLRTPAWDEVTRLVDAAAARHGLDRPGRNALHRAAMEGAIDPAGSGEPWGMWGEYPCPRCGSRERSSTRPAGGQQTYVRRSVEPAGWTGWSALAPEARAAAVEAARVTGRDRS